MENIDEHYYINNNLITILRSNVVKFNLFAKTNY